MTLVGLVIGLLVIGILWWAVQRIIAAFHIGEPWATAIVVVFAILAVLALVGGVAVVPRYVRIF
jgi:uncharacterized membrane protein YwzB